MENGIAGSGTFEEVPDREDRCPHDKNTDHIGFHLPLPSKSSLTPSEIMVNPAEHGFGGDFGSEKYKGNRQHP